MTSNDKQASGSIERLVPAEIDDSDVGHAQLYRQHVERYEFAAKFAGSGRVLDCACGAGYGSQILLRDDNKTRAIVGVDIDPVAIAHARANYGREGVSFVCADGVQFDGEHFDTIISFETIEHVPDPDALIDNLARLLKPDGRFIASVPITPSVDINPYHLHDFTETSFRRMFYKRGFKEVDCLLQIEPFDAVKNASDGARLKRMFAYYSLHPGSAFKRAYSTLVDGFCNKYLACVWERA